MRDNTKQRDAIGLLPGEEADPLTLIRIERVAADRGLGLVLDPILVLVRAGPAGCSKWCRSPGGPRLRWPAAIAITI